MKETADRREPDGLKLELGRAALSQQMAPALTIAVAYLTACAVQYWRALPFPDQSEDMMLMAIITAAMMISSSRRDSEAFLSRGFGATLPVCRAALRRRRNRAVLVGWLMNSLVLILVALGVGITPKWTTCGAVVLFSLDVALLIRNTTNPVFTGMAEFSPLTNRLCLETLAVFAACMTAAHYLAPYSYFRIVFDFTEHADDPRGLAFLYTLAIPILLAALWLNLRVLWLEAGERIDRRPLPHKDWRVWKQGSRTPMHGRPARRASAGKLRGDRR